MYFVLVDIIQDTFCDKNNLEEASSLARMIQVLNPKLLSKKGKEAFYAFRAVYKDIYLAILSEFLCSFLGISHLNTDCTPERIQSMSSDEDRQFAFEELFRSFVIKTHGDFESCSVTKDETKQLPLFYPHHDFHILV